VDAARVGGRGEGAGEASESREARGRDVVFGLVLGL
jgi:hypothetical protein